ncbi:MAG: flagellar basal body rod protein FlgB [Oligoflexia bacterium]|nr:flagellar basal body rod protein FlgB [Oligoflexia bacterium]
MTVKVFDKTFDALAKTLDLRSQNAVIINSNIANADTPGYQAKELNFEKALAGALSTNNGDKLVRTSDMHLMGFDEISNVQAELSNQVNNVVREDGNTVDRDMELMSLAENQAIYNTAVDLVRKKIALLKYSITDGGNH